MVKPKSANVVTFDPNTGVLLIVGGTGNATVTVRMGPPEAPMFTQVDDLLVPADKVKKIRVNLSAGKWCLCRFEFQNGEAPDGDRQLHYSKCKNQQFTRRTAFLGRTLAWTINRPMDLSAQISVVSAGQDGGTILDLGNPGYIDPDGEFWWQMGYPIEPEFDADGDKDDWAVIMEKRGTPWPGPWPGEDFPNYLAAVKEINPSSKRGKK